MYAHVSKCKNEKIKERKKAKINEKHKCSNWNYNISERKCMGYFMKWKPAKDFCTRPQKVQETKAKIGN
jgi:hypothetical protein